MTNRFLSLLAIAGLSLAAAACESTATDLSGARVDDATFNRDNGVPIGPNNQVADPLNSRMPSSPPAPSNDPGNFRPDLSATPDHATANEGE